MLGIGLSSTAKANERTYPFYSFVVNQEGGVLNGAYVINTEHGTYSGAIIDGFFSVELLATGLIYVSIYVDGYEVEYAYFYVLDLEEHVFRLTKQQENFYTEIPSPKEVVIMERNFLCLRKD